jgi:hypothetical protein
VKLIAEYLEHALQFERLAADENDPTLKTQFQQRALAYRRLADKRAAQLGLTIPPKDDA